MLRVREAWRLMSEKKESPKKPCYAPRTRSILSRRVRAQHTVGEVSAQQKESRPGRHEYGDIQGLVTVEDILEEIVAISPRRCRQHLPKRSRRKTTVGDYRWHRQRARN